MYLVVYNQIGDTIMVVVNLEELCQTRLTDVETTITTFLPSKASEIPILDATKVLPSPDVEEVNIITFSPSFSIKLNIGTQATENLLHQVVYILVNHNVSLSLPSWQRRLP